MSTKTEKVKIVRFPPELWERVEDHRYAHRIPSAMATLRELLDLGLQAARREPEKAA